jgi:hypothetical protein
MIPLGFLSKREVWLGTSDDWIGEDDRPTKETGHMENDGVKTMGFTLW